MSEIDTDNRAALCGWPTRVTAEHTLLRFDEPSRTWEYLAEGLSEKEVRALLIKKAREAVLGTRFKIRKKLVGVDESEYRVVAADDPIEGKMF